MPSVASGRYSPGPGTDTLLGDGIYQELRPAVANCSPNEPDSPATEAEKPDRKDARVTVEEVAIEPGGHVRPHRHAGPVFGYVLEGEYEHALDDDPVATYKAGDTFYEPTGRVHRVTRNPSARAKTRLLAVILHPRDAEQVTVPEEAAKTD